MKPAIQHRIPVALRSIAELAACTLAGLLVGFVAAFESTEMKLDHYARQLIAYAEAYNSEITATLDQVNASPYPFCSDQDVNRLRDLVYHGHVVKEIGRVRDSTVYCSSVKGRLDHPQKNRPRTSSHPPEKASG